MALKLNFDTLTETQIQGTQKLVVCYRRRIAVDKMLVNSKREVKKNQTLLKKDDKLYVFLDMYASNHRNRELLLRINHLIPFNRLKLEIKGTNNELCKTSLRKIVLGISGEDPSSDHYDSCSSSTSY